MKSKLLPGLLALLTGAALHAQSVTVTGDVTPFPDPNPSASWHPTDGDEFIIGVDGAGTMTIADGGTVTVSMDDYGFGATIGQNAGSDGTVTVTGAGSFFELTTDLYVGDAGTGHLLVADGGRVHLDGANLYLGENGGSGDVTVTGAGSELIAYGDITIGDGESEQMSTLTIKDGGLVTLDNPIGSLTLAADFDSQGTLNFGAHDLDNATTTGTLDAARIEFGYGTEATVNFNQTDDLVLSAALEEGTSRSSIHQRGTGTTTLTGDNSDYDGNIQVSDGTLVIASTTSARDLTVSGTAAATLTLAAGANVTVDEDNSVNLATDADSAGTLNFGAYDGTTTTGTLDADSITIGSGAGVINFNQTDALSLDAQITGTGTLNQRGTGTTTLTHAASTYTGEINVTAGTLAFTHALSLTGDGSLSVTGTGSLTTGGHNLNLGLASGENTTLLIDGSDASVTNATAAIGYASGSSGAATVTNGATWTNIDDLHLGQYGSGSLTLGVDVDDTATVTVSRLRLGFNTGGSGELTINGGTLSASGFVTIGYAAGSTGTVTMNGGALATASEVRVGTTGTGTLTLNDGAITGTRFVLGVDSGSTGTATMNGGTITASGEMLIGNSGSGALTLDGGDITAAAVTVGQNSGANGTLAVNAGTISSADEVRVGNNGGGALTLSGGTLSGTVANIARNAGSTGTVTMTGGEWNNSSLLVVGNTGNGTLTQSGGVITASEGHIGYNATGAGTLNLLGGGTVTLNGGAGTLNIARVSGATGTLNLGAYDLSGTAGTLNAASIAFGAGTGTVNFNQTGALTLAAAISGTGTVNQRGSGFTTLTGLNTYTGATHILGGTLALGNGASLSGSGVITVASGATFDVSALAGGFTLGAGQTLTGGGTILGDLMFDAASTVHFDLGGYDLAAIDVTGDLAYAGALSLSLIDGFAPVVGNTFQLFDVTGGYNGAFSSITFTNAALAGSFDYATGTLTISAVPEPSTYAIIFGVLALGFVIYRRRRS